MSTIKNIELEKRDDNVKNYIATLDNGETVGVEADSKKEAEEKITKYLEEEAAR